MAAQSTPKGMSSRLLTMKFMQRAATSSSPASASNPSTPISDESASKRRKVSHNRPVKDEVDYTVDRQAIQAAIDEDERKREDALVRRAAELGDARWVLNVQGAPAAGAETRKPLQVVQVGYAQIDSHGNPEDSEDSDDDAHGTVPIRRYNMGKKKSAPEASDPDDNDSDSSDGSDSSNASSSEDEGGSRSRTPLAKKSSAAQRNDYARKASAEKVRAKEFADKRRRKEVKLNRANPQSSGGLSSGGGMLSLSSGGRPMRQSGSFSFTCHNCGEAGHKVADCNKPKNRSR